MRVTKNVREYIEEQVRIKAEQSESIAELKKKADDVTKKFNDDMNRLREECDVLLNNAISKYALVDHCGHKPHTNFAFCYDSYLPEVVAYKKALNDLREKRRLAVMNIIAEMELGGSKADLEEKLNNLTF